MSNSALAAARNFIEHEKQFHLGFLPTEQSSPLTKNLDKEFARGSIYGVANLQSVDRNVLAMARKIFASAEFAKLVAAGEKVIRSGGKVVFSGCGATGRLSILLECMYRDCCANTPELAQYRNNVFSIMTGGDYALVRSVEFFEDYQSFGRQQVKELDMTDRDMLVAITEGGETSSVLGTVFEALDRGCQTFLMFNNPADLLAEHLERSRQAICDERVCVLDLYCGPMALAGSTRMQATTSEQLIAGAALESIVLKLLGNALPDYARLFETLLDDLESPAARQGIADYIDFEANCYKNKGLLTYFADDYLLDIFTDTTERSPTFMLPPFRKYDDKVSPRPWTFVKNPLRTTDEVWSHGMNRELRCLDWSTDLYLAMGAPEKVLTNPPLIQARELKKFLVGSEDIADRISGGCDAAVLVTLSTGRTNAELKTVMQDIQKQLPCSKHLSIGCSCGDFAVPCKLEHSPLEIMSHMAVKLVLNTASTGIMAVLGRVTGNWMSYVDVSNKKLIDRATRLISEIGEMDYEKACIMLFEAIEELAESTAASDERVSTVQYVLNKIKKQQ
ncbi:MAG: sugar phosphate isomerase [Lentisphaerae bacterium]|nr:sugar phosphate isomerase [Lentisphaerota bacterium]